MERDYKKIELSDLAQPGHPEFLEVTGIARASREEHYQGVIGNPQGFYFGLLQSPSDKNFFVQISGMTNTREDLSRVLILLGSSSEANLPVTLKGRYGSFSGTPQISHISEIRLGNLTYKCGNDQLI